MPPQNNFGSTGSGSATLVVYISLSFQVEFPEARIYEETLNCLLYENRTGPDQDLMQATSARGAVASYTSDDEEERRFGGGGGGGHGGGGGGMDGAAGLVVGPGQPPASRGSTGLARLRASKH